MRTLVLTICLLSLAAPFAAAQNGQGQNGQGQNGQGQNGQGQNGQHPRQHAAEMSGTAMAVAGVIGLGGYLFIRRRAAPQN